MKNFVFVHNPKTGGETIQTLLKIRKSHDYPYFFKKSIKKKYSFTFVRHPVSRMVSWYNHLLKHLYVHEIENNVLNAKSQCYNLLTKGNIKMGPEKHRILAENNDINNWIKIMLTNVDEYVLEDKKHNQDDVVEYGPLSLQHKYVFDVDCKTQLVTDVFRFENYEEELKRLLKKLDKEHLIPEIHKTNHSKKKSEKLNDESLQLIYNYFQKDFELFDYKLEDYPNL